MNSCRESSGLFWGREGGGGGGGGSQKKETRKASAVVKSDDVRPCQDEKEVGHVGAEVRQVQVYS